MQTLLDLPLKLSHLPPNEYDVHCMVYDVMLGEKSDKVRDFLFTTFRDLGGMVLIRSASFPENMRSFGQPVAVPAVGETRTFELVASPMFKDGGTTKPLPKGDPDARLSWLSRMGSRHGFEIRSATVSSRPIHYDRKGSKFWLERAEFRGELVVRDAQLTAAALKNGIGRARSLGHGMMRWA